MVVALVVAVLFLSVIALAAYAERPGSRTYERRRRVSAFPRGTVPGGAGFGWGAGGGGSDGGGCGDGGGGGC